MTGSSHDTARWLITVATICYGLGPFVLDMNRTHLLHPRWTGHARFHLLWAAVSQFLIGGLALWITWSPDFGSPVHLRLATLIGLCMTSGFWAASISRKFYGGTLHDTDGIPPILGKIDGNVLAVLGIQTLLLTGLLFTLDAHS